MRDLAILAIRLMAVWWAFSSIASFVSSLLFMPWNAEVMGEVMAEQGTTLWYLVTTASMAAVVQLGFAAGLFVFAEKVSGVLSADMTEPKMPIIDADGFRRVGLFVGGSILVAVALGNAIAQYFSMQTFGVSHAFPALASALPGIGLIWWANRK